jgi:peptidoglycan glycosyltransferase
VNRQIRLVSLVSGLMVFALLANLTYFTVAREQPLHSASSNVRTVYEEYDRQRGAILAGTTVIAETVAAPEEDLFERQRLYPEGSLYAHITGYYSFVYGTRGIENSYDEYLAGTSSAQWMQSLIDSWEGSTPVGATVQTTIDPVLQRAATEALGDSAGAIVVLDPSTGAVLALVSTPSYDPNLLATHDFDTIADSWNALIGSPERPMANRAAREVYPPGSTAKLITAAAALAAGYTPDSLIDTPSSVQLPGSESWLPNYSPQCGDGQQTLAFALAWSCNTSFANLGAALGADALLAQAEAFGFNSTHLDDLGDAPSRYYTAVGTSGDLYRLYPNDAQVMMSAIGQWEVAASPLQMAMVVAAIINDGVLMEPYVVERVTQPDQTVLYQHAAESSRAMTAENAAALAEMMRGVVYATGASADIPGVDVGGKTGTAEWAEDQPPYSWMVAFATDPDIVVAAFVESAPVEATDMASGVLVGPMVRAVLEASR